MFTLQYLPACDPEGPTGDTVGKEADFSLHAGVVARFEERRKLGGYADNTPRLPGESLALYKILFFNKYFSIR